MRKQIYKKDNVPVYTFTCPECGVEEEFIQHIEEYDNIHICNKCLNMKPSRYITLQRFWKQDTGVYFEFNDKETGKILKDTLPPEIRDEYDTI